MKTILFRQHGGPEVLEYADFPTPEPKAGEALIRLRAAALNRMDVLVRNGWQGLKLELPHINGADGAGEVAELGENTAGFKVGDRVAINANLGCGNCEFCLRGQDNLCSHWHLLGETVRGTYAEYICLPVRQLYKLPADFDFHASAAAALVYQTAWHSMVKRGKVKAGETVAIVGAGGGVNSASIQVAKYLGARVAVIGSNPEKLKKAEELRRGYFDRPLAGGGLVEGAFHRHRKTRCGCGRGQRRHDLPLEPAGTAKRRASADSRQQRRASLRNRQPLYFRQTSLGHRLDHEHARRFRRGDGPGDGWYT